MRNLIWLWSVLLVSGISSCKKNSVEEPELLGARICGSSQFHYTKPFMVNGATQPVDVDFTASPYYVAITAGLSERVSWTVTITGKNSGAVKTFTQFSDKVNVNWYGNADGDVFFQDGEVCQVSLEPSCKNAVTIDVTITHKSTFDQMGVLVYDCDNIRGGSVAVPYSLTINRDTLYSPSSPQGGKCHILYAAQGASGWYFGAYVQAYGVQSRMASFASGLTADDLYMNVYIKGAYGNLATIAVYEKVNGEIVPFRKTILIDWTGWKMVCFKLSDIHIGDPTQIVEYDFIASPQTYNATTEVYTDFMIVTKGKPFSGAN